jgi:hypothetical protein
MKKKGRKSTTAQGKGSDGEDTPEEDDEEEHEEEGETTGIAHLLDIASFATSKPSASTTSLSSSKPSGSATKTSKRLVTYSTVTQLKTNKKTNRSVALASNINTSVPANRTTVRSRQQPQRPAAAAANLKINQAKAKTIITLDDLDEEDEYDGGELTSASPPPKKAKTKMEKNSSGTQHNATETTELDLLREQIAFLKTQIGNQMVGVRSEERGNTNNQSTNEHEDNENNSNATPKGTQQKSSEDKESENDR